MPYVLWCNVLVRVVGTCGGGTITLIWAVHRSPYCPWMSRACSRYHTLHHRCESLVLRPRVAIVTLWISQCRRELFVVSVKKVSQITHRIPIERLLDSTLNITGVANERVCVFLGLRPDVNGHIFAPERRKLRVTFEADIIVILPLRALLHCKVIVP